MTNHITPFLCPGSSWYITQARYVSCGFSSDLKMDKVKPFGYDGFTFKKRKLKQLVCNIWDNKEKSLGVEKEGPHFPSLSHKGICDSHLVDSVASKSKVDRPMDSLPSISYYASMSRATLITYKAIILWLTVCITELWGPRPWIQW